MMVSVCFVRSLTATIFSLSGFFPWWDLASQESFLYPRSLSSPESPARLSHWNGWPNVEKIFIFGDSYTDTGFNINSQQPTPSSPLGNPEKAPDDADMTWPYYLTTKYNDSLLQTYCLAKSGSTVDHAILPHGNSFTEQMSQYWLPKYSKQWDMYDLAAISSEIRLDDYSNDNIVEKHNYLAGNKKVQETIEKKFASKWSSSTSLFAVFFGVNDVIVTLEDPLKDQVLVFNAIFATYKRLLRQLYKTGARNFLLFNVPPVQRLPNIHGSEILKRSRAVKSWNNRLTHLKQDFTTEFNDIRVFLFDTNALFNKVIDHPKAFEQTKGYLNTTQSCPQYSAVKKQATFYKECGIRYEQYLWRDALHPTFPVHKAIAAQVGELLRNTAEP